MLTRSKIEKRKLIPYVKGTEISADYIHQRYLSLVGSSIGEVQAVRVIADQNSLHPDQVRACIEYFEPKKKKKNERQSLLAKAQRVFNKWIRKRDEGKPCINCGNYRKLEAGHLYPTSTHGGLRFDEDNTNGECKHCNHYDSQSHAFGYAPNLKKRIGEHRFKNLEIRADYCKRNKKTWSEFELGLIINKFKLP